MSNLGFGLISADSHIVEPADCYSKYIDSKYRDSAPTIERDDLGNDVYVIPEVVTFDGRRAIPILGPNVFGIAIGWLDNVRVRRNQSET